MTRPRTALTAPDDVGPRVRPFLDWLREQSSGKTADELSEALHDLIAKVVETEKKGTLALKVSVTWDKKLGLLVVSDNISLTLPEHDRQDTVWFLDEDGNLARDDPSQLPFESLREVPPPPGVDPITGEILTREVI